MILIGGTKLQASELPNSELVNYSVTSDIRELGIKLRTTAKTGKCIKVYLSEEVAKDVSYTHLPSDKVVFYENDAELIRLLSGDNEPSEDKAEQVEIPAKAVSKEEKEVYVSSSISSNYTDDVMVDDKVGVDSYMSHKKGVEICSINKVPTVDIEMVDTDLPSDIFNMPGMLDDIDNIKISLTEKDIAIKQKDEIISSLMKDKETMANLHNSQLSQLKTTYESKIREANNTIGKLKQTVQDAKLDDYLLSFCKYATYTTNKKASSRESFTEDDMKRIGRLSSKIHIISCGSGDSMYSMLTKVKGLIDGGFDGLVVDFSNDSYLRAKYKITNNQLSSILLGDEGFTVPKLSKEVNRCTFIPTTLYNDISLLMVDWVEVIKRLDMYAGGKDIVLLFGNINNFTVRHTVSKLSTIGSLNVFVKCNPIILSSLWGDLKFIPAERVRVVALDYIDMVSTFITELGKTHSVLAFESDIEWSKLSIRA